MDSLESLETSWNYPNIIVVSCSNTEPVSIINMLATRTDIKEKTNEVTPFYRWNIDTKYYTAEVNIHPLKTHENKEYLKEIEAIVIHFDSNKKTGLDDLKKWQEFVGNHQPDIKILIADIFNEKTEISKRNAIGWCLENGFELIELNPKQTGEESSEDEIIKETKGVERVIEALKTHMWSNLVIKSKVSEYSKIESEPIDPASSSNIDKMLDNLMLDDDQLEFGDLFQRLHMMKESVQSMSLRERRHCAEQVVAAFWKTIGGDEDEVGNI